MLYNLFRNWNKAFEISNLLSDQPKTISFSDKSLPLCKYKYNLPLYILEVRVVVKTSLNDLKRLVHLVLDLSANNINLNQLPNWSRESIPKTPIIQKLGLIAISLFYPLLYSKIEINDENFGPHSPQITEATKELIEVGDCIIYDDEGFSGQLVVKPTTYSERREFLEIFNFLQDLIDIAQTSCLSQFEFFEIFSVIAVEHASFLAKQDIFRRKFDIKFNHQIQICKSVFSRLKKYPHLYSFIKEHGEDCTYDLVQEIVYEFYSLLNNSQIRFQKF